MNVEYSETVVIGAGQQGCGVAAALQDLGLEAIVLERGEIGQAWASERWDSLVVGSGNRTVRFPGWEYDGDDPDGCMPGRELAWHLRRYVENRKLDVRQHTPVARVEMVPGAAGGDAVRFRTRLASGPVLESRNVVAALGGYANPRIPELAADVHPDVCRLHSRDYRNPAGLPDGAVLVVGAGISGQEIADELVGAGRRVFLSAGRHRAFPRCYRARDIHDWFFVFSLYEDFVARHRKAEHIGEQPVVLGLPVAGAKNRGADLNLGTLSAKGVVVIGSVRAARGQVLTLEPNAGAIAREAAESYAAVLDKIDAGLVARGFAAPPENPRPGVDVSRITEFGTEFDLAANNVTTIVWCTGYGPDYRILPADVLDESGDPIRQRGMLGAVPGLYYAGLPDEHSLDKTGIPSCVDNGRFIAQQVYVDAVLRSGSPASVVPG